MQNQQAMKFDCQVRNIFAETHVSPLFYHCIYLLWEVNEYLMSSGRL